MTTMGDMTESNNNNPVIGERIVTITPHVQTVEWDGTVWRFVCDCGEVVHDDQPRRRAIFAQTIVHVGCEDVRGAQIRSTCRTERGG